MRSFEQVIYRHCLTCLRKCLTVKVQVRGGKEGVRQFLCLISKSIASDLRFCTVSCAASLTGSDPVLRQGSSRTAQGRAETPPDPPPWAINLAHIRAIKASLAGTQ